jgi:prophage regulatory protein
MPKKPKTTASHKTAAAAKRPQHPWLRGLARSLPPLSEPAPSANPPRLMDKAEVCRIANASFPSIWSWMRAGKFPRSRIVAGRSMWLSTEIENWLRALPVRPLKGDGDHSEAAE